MNIVNRIMKLTFVCITFSIVGQATITIRASTDELLKAVRSGSIDVVVKLLVEHEVNLNEYFGESEVHLLAVSLGNDDIDMFKKLLMGGADPNAKCSRRSNLSVGELIIDAPMREDFLVEALRFGLNPNLMTIPYMGADEKMPLIFRTAGHSFQLSYFIILLNHGVLLEASSDWVELFERALVSENYRMAWYLLASKKLDERSLMNKTWSSGLFHESREAFHENVAYWRDLVIDEIESRNAGRVARGFEVDGGVRPDHGAEGGGSGQGARMCGDATESATVGGGESGD